MKCPNCKDVNLLMTDRNGVEIDYCPECRGVWLDRGELDKIIERDPQTSSSRTSSNKIGSYHTPGSDQDYHRKKKKDSFLGDLFDF